MASEKEASCQNLCVNDPNFAIICSFFDRFSISCGVVHPTFSDLQEMIESSEDVPRELVDLHVKLLRKIRKSVTTEKWERALIKFCHSYYCSEDGWELERCGYKKCRVSVKLRILKTLLDAQFDLNSKFKNDVNKLTAEELRIEPLGKDKVGQSYWCQFDSSANVRVYKEDQDEETWKLVAKDRSGLVDLITQLSSGEELLGLELINEDSNSQEVEKPIIDTGQVEMTTSEENTADYSSSIDMKVENDSKEDADSFEDSQNKESSEVINGNTLLKQEVTSFKTVKDLGISKEKDSHTTEDCKSSSMIQDFESDISENKTDSGDITDNLSMQSKDLKETVNSEKEMDLTNSMRNSNNVENKESTTEEKTNKYSEDSNIDVTEEIKQRSLFKSNTVSVFKAKGSKLDQIFSRKFDNSGSKTDHDLNLSTNLTTTKLPEREENYLSSSLHENIDTFYKTSPQKNDTDICPTNKKRGAEEISEQAVKKKCVEVDQDDEVGEAIEEPVLIIKGEGSGKECDTGNPERINDADESSLETKNKICSSNEVERSSKENQSTSNDQVSLKNTVQEETEINVNTNLIGNMLDCKPKTKDYCDVKTQLENNDLEVIPGNLKEEKENISVSETVAKITKNDSEQFRNISCESEKSIEEQLCDITGEKFIPSPKEDTSNSKENSDETSKNIEKSKDSENGVIRKSFDLNNSTEDNIVSEAKKTKILQENLDIFGSLSDNETNDNKVNEGLNNENNNSSSSNVVDGPEPVNNKSSIDNDSQLLININSNENNTSIPKFDNSEDGDGLINQEVKAQKGVEMERKCNYELKDKILDDENLKESNLKKENSYPVESIVAQDTCEELKCSKEKIDELHESNTNSNIKKTGITIPLETTNNSIEEAQKEMVPEAKQEEKCSKDVKENKNTVNKPIKPVIVDEAGKISPKENNSELKEENLPVDEEALPSKLQKRKKSKEELNSSGNENLGKESNDVVSFSEEELNSTKRRPSPKKSPKARRKVFTPKSKKRTGKKIDSGSIENNCKKLAKIENEKSEDIESLQKEGLHEDEHENKSEDKNEECRLQTNKKGKTLDKAETKPEQVKNRKRRSSRRNTGTEKESEDDVTSDKKENNDDHEDEIGGKRRKIKGKRTTNKTARKLVEDKRNTKSSSEEDNQDNENKESKRTPIKKTTEKTKTTIKNITKTKPQNKNKKDSPESIKINQEPTHANKKKKISKPQGRNSRAYLGIDLNIDINESSRSVRQSSRLAQIKIKEQVDHKLEDNHQKPEKPGKKSKKKKDQMEDNQKGSSKKRNKAKVEVENEEEFTDPDPSERKRSRKKKKRNPLKFNEHNPWKSSSGSSSEAEEEEEDHFDEIVEEEEDLVLNIKSDHEFSPESDLENDDEWKPIRRARTAKKDPEVEDKEATKETDDFACEKCGKKDHPEWILLCDTCDHGWHASCLRPSLMLVPEGDWHCPTCQHAVLVKRLQETLKIYDRDTKRRENEELRKKRLAYVGISLDNVLPLNSNQPREKRQESGSESESSESSRSSSGSESEDSDEPVYQLRQRRQGTTSYRFNEFDELINSAIQDEVQVGKTISVSSNVVPTIGSAVVPNDQEIKITGDNMNKEEVETKGVDENGASSVVEKVSSKNVNKNKTESGEDSSEEDDDEEEEGEEEFPSVVPKRNNVLPRPGKKKHRRLNCLDDPSDDDDGSDEDFKGSSSEEEDEEEEDDDSDDSDIKRRGRSKRGHLIPVRRSSRARRSRFDKEFINDDSDESDAPRRKKTKKLWSESESESEDSTWGRRKKKKGVNSSGRKKKNKKFTIEDELSEAESSKTPKKKRQRKIKYGGLDDLNVEELPARRTRGMKINYQEVIGTDSDEDIKKSKSTKRAVIEDEEEFVAEKEEEISGTSSDDGKNQEDEDGSGDDNSSEEDVKIIQMPEKPQVREEKVQSINPPKVSPPKAINNDKAMNNRRGRPPKAMIAPPPERLISEDEQYKAVVSKVSTLNHPENSISKRPEIEFRNAANIHDMSNKVTEPKEFIEPVQPITPIKIPNSSFDPKLIKRSPPIKIRSGVPVNPGGRKSPGLISPTKEISLFPVSPTNPGIIHSPPDKSVNIIQMQKNVAPVQGLSQSFFTATKSINQRISSIKSESLPIEDDNDLDEDDLIDDIEEEEEEDEDDSDDDILEEGEIPKKVARRMARMEEKLQKKLHERKLSKLQTKPVKTSLPESLDTKSNNSGIICSEAMNSEQKPTPTTQPSQPLLRVVSPLKLMANPPGPLQSTFMHSGINPRMPVSSPPPRLTMPLRAPLPPNAMPPVMSIDDGSSAKRKGRGRGKKPGVSEKPDQNMVSGSNVIRGMLQQPQSYPPTQYSQQYPPHPRIPFNPQRMPRPPFHPPHHTIDPSPSGGGSVNVKQEPGSHPATSNPVHIPNKPPYPHPPQHRFDSLPRQPNYPPQGKQQFGSYPPHSTPNANFHYGSYPPPPIAPPSREEQAYPVQQPYNEQFSDQTGTPSAAPANKSAAEEESGEFGGLVSYFSSQREYDIDT